jgi:pSer/pThr/pTyr-binding forkhead associated (FHA) protein
MRVSGQDAASEVCVMSDAAQKFEVGASGLRFGRSLENDIHIDDSRASRLHAELRREGSSVVLVDLTSRNGTLLNGRPLEAPRRLADGDRIEIAGRIFTFLDPLATRADPSARPLTIDEDRCQAWAGGHLLDLTAKEFALLVVLFEYRAGICPKQVVAERVWPEYGGAVADNNIDSLVSRLRAKVATDLVTIENARGVGYKLVVGQTSGRVDARRAPQ